MNKSLREFLQKSPLSLDGWNGRQVQFLYRENKLVCRIMGRDSENRRMTGYYEAETENDLEFAIKEWLKEANVE